MYLILVVRSLCVARDTSELRMRGGMLGESKPRVDALDEHLANVICNPEGSWRAKRSPQGSSGLSGLTLAFFQYILPARNNNIERIMG